MEEKIKILFLAADPSDIARLRLGQELRDIREKLQLSKHRDKFTLDSRESVRTGDITQAIFDVEPQIIHFSGHGTNIGELCFEDIQGKTQPVKPSALANLFKLMAKQIDCVVLNACYSKKQAEAIAQHIPYVIGMNKDIGDKAAIVFATAFYKALGAGQSFRDAYSFACVEIQLAGIPEDTTPIFLEKEKVSFQKASVELTNSATTLFSDRFAKAFPGVRGIKSFDASEAIVRLSKLVEEPLTFKKGDFYIDPIWWWRGYTNSDIRSFEVIGDDIVLLNHQELKIKSIIAVNPGRYHQCFVYLEASPMEPTGLYTWEEKVIKEITDELGYCKEEFGLYKRKHFITRAEHDDYAAYIDGELLELEPEFNELRIRYLSPYNLVIAAIDSPINNTSFDESFEELMNGILKGSANVETLLQEILRLPKQYIR